MVVLCCCREHFIKLNIQRFGLIDINFLFIYPDFQMVQVTLQNCECSFCDAVVLAVLSYGSVVVISDVYITYGSGPMTLPCGTPE